MKKDSKSEDYGEKKLKVSRKTEHQNSSQKSEKNLDLEEGWSWRKSLGRSREAQDVQVSTDWDEFLINQVFLNSICIFYFYYFCFFFFFELLEAVYQLLFNVTCVLDLNLEKLWISGQAVYQRWKLWISWWQAVLSSGQQAVGLNSWCCCSYSWTSCLNLVKRFNHVNLVLFLRFAHWILNSAIILFCIDF